MKPEQSPSKPETLAAQALGRVAEPFRDIVPPLHLSTTFERAGDGSYPGGRVYSRDGSPAYSQVEELLAILEGGDSSLLFGSGMAAAASVFQSLGPGHRVVAPRNMYWALRKWLIGFAEQWQLDLAFYDNADLADLEHKLSVGRPSLLWIETPANPTWELTDILAATELAHHRGAWVAVDATVLTPVHAQPLKLGADLVMHAATKYLNGHSDVVAGALIARKDLPLWERIKTVRALGGAVLGPFEAWLLLRGMRTLYPRVRTASASALKLAEHLEAHSAVTQVLYPGLPSHPQHELAKRQYQGGFGAMLSIRLRGGEPAARFVAGNLKVFKQATSLGSVESLVEHRASVEGPGSFCPADLLRLSIGIEHAGDLLEDFDRTLELLEPGLIQE